jgi:hypothetical protein
MDTTGGPDIQQAAKKKYQSEVTTIENKPFHR